MSALLGQFCLGLFCLTNLNILLFGTVFSGTVLSRYGLFSEFTNSRLSSFDTKYKAENYVEQTPIKFFFSSGHFH